MSWEAWYVVGIIGLVVIALVSGRMNVDVAMFGGLTLLLVGDAIFGDILKLEAGIRGFANPAIFMIGALFIVAAGLQETGGMEIIAQRLLGRPKTVAGAQLRMMTPVAIMSGFMNNTPIVAMYLPIISDWARKLRISPSLLYMPLSFAAIMGGKLTLIGSASNIVVMGLYVQYLTDQGDALPSATKQFWGIAALGAPTTIVGLLLIAFISRRLLPNRRPATEEVLDARKYQVEMMVQNDAPFVGKSIEDAGLRHLPGLYLTQIERGDEVMSAVGPEEILHAGDRLAFAGILDSVVDLRKIRGLTPATDQVQKIAPRRDFRTLVEAVVAHNSPLVGRTVRASRFRTKYNAAIIAVHRNGAQVNAKIGDIELQAGDTLLLDTHTGFIGAYRNSDDFYLVSQVEGSRPVRHERAWIALVILGLLVACLTLNLMKPIIAALLCAGLMIGTRCITGTDARNSVNWQVLVVIGSALGMGAALNQTGAAEQIADSILSLCHGFGPQAMLLVLILLASLFAQFVTNNGSAVLMFPIMMATASDLGVSPEPFVFSLIIASGATFLSPVGYQTNLMVYGPGGYKFLDYARLGLPLTLLIALLCALIAPLWFPFQAAS